MRHLFVYFLQFTPRVVEILVWNSNLGFGFGTSPQSLISLHLVGGGKNLCFEDETIFRMRLIKYKVYKLELRILLTKYYLSNKNQKEFSNLFLYNNKPNLKSFIREINDLTNYFQYPESQNILLKLSCSLFEPAPTQNSFSPKQAAVNNLTMAIHTRIPQITEKSSAKYETIFIILMTNNSNVSLFAEKARQSVHQ